MAVGDVIRKIRGISNTLFSIGLTAVVQIKNATGVFEVRNGTDTGYVIGRGADPVGANDWVTRGWLSANAGGGGTVTWGNRSLLSTTATRYLTAGCSSKTAPDTDDYAVPAPLAGLIRDLVVEHNTPAGNGNPVVYTVLINGVASALTVSVASTTASGSDFVTTVAVAQGDLISLRATKAASIGNGLLRPQVSARLAAA
jgi:hypothetical protein